MKKRINLPRRVLYSAGCVFTRSKLFYADHNGRRILQFTSNGVYQRVSATGHRFLRFTARGNLLYTTMHPSKRILAYNIRTRRIQYRLATTSANARGLAFGPGGYLHVSTWGKIVEFFTYQGHEVGQHRDPQLDRADGILIDSNYYTIIADRGRRQVFVFTHTGVLTKRITGFGDPLDVAMGYRCGYLLFNKLQTSRMSVSTVFPRKEAQALIFLSGPFSSKNSRQNFKKSDELGFKPEF